LIFVVVERFRTRILQRNPAPDNKAGQSRHPGSQRRRIGRIPAQAERRISQELVDRQPALIDTAVARIGENSSPDAQVYFLWNRRCRAGIPALPSASATTEYRPKHRCS